MNKRLLKGVALGSLLLGLATTTPSIQMDSLPRLTLSQTVRADDGTGDVKPFIILDDDRGVAEYVDAVNKRISKEFGDENGKGAGEVVDGWKFLTFTPATKKLEFDRETLMSKSYKVRKGVLEIAVNSSEGTMGERDKARTISYLRNVDASVTRVLEAINKDTRPDIAWAMSFQRHTQEPVNKFLGVAMIIIPALFGLHLATDLFFMTTTPAMELALKGSKGKKPFFISPEAYYSYKETMAKDVYSNYLLKYLTRSVPKMILLGLSLACIVAGNITYVSMFFARLLKM